MRNKKVHRKQEDTGVAKLFERVKSMMFGAEEYDEEYENEGYEEEGYAEASSKEPEYGNLRAVREPEYSTSGSRRADASPKVNSQVSSITASVQMQVVIIKPECYEDAQDISDQIKTKRPVVVNLEKVPFPVGQRIMDFLSGTCYSLEGSIQRVAHNIFVIAPENVDISAHFKEELKTKGAIYSFNNKTAAR